MDSMLRYWQHHSLRWIAVRLVGHFTERTIPVNTARLDIEGNLWNFLGGVQLKDNAKEGTFKPFAHAWVGVPTRETKSTQC